MATTQAAQEGGLGENEEPHKVSLTTSSDKLEIYYTRPPLCGQVLLLGDSGVGKTSIFQRFLRNTFEHKVSSTIGERRKLQTTLT